MRKITFFLLLSSFFLMSIATYSQVVEAIAPPLSNGLEILATYRVDDSMDYYTVRNGTGVNNQFIPTIIGNHESDERRALLFIAATSEVNDIINDQPLMSFDTRLDFDSGSEKTVESRPLFGWSNFNDTKMILSASGNLGLGTIAPAAKFQVADGDIYIEDIGNGVIMKSANGLCWRYTPDNSGVLMANQITCP